MANVAENTASSPALAPVTVQESSPNPNDLIIRVEDAHGDNGHDQRSADSEEVGVASSPGIILCFLVL